MKRTLRVLRALGIGLAALLVVALGLVYAVSQRQLSRSYAAAPLSAFRADAAADAALLAEGERLARTRGCFGCHGPALEGRVFMDEPWVARIVAPNLTRAVPEYSDAELERLVRRGVRRDGKGVWVMASNMYYHLSDDDLAAIVAYLRSLPPRDGPPMEMEVRPLGRVGLAIGQFPAITEEIDAAAPRMAVERGDPIAFGRYLATTSCTECHGAALEGYDDTPDLRIAAAYTAEQFEKLMRTGLALGDRDTGFMSGVARGRFSHFTDEEVAALYAYLRRRAAG
jgi:cytochrome c553